MVNRLRVTFGGALGTASDWSNTLEFALGSPVPDQATLQTIVNAARTTLGSSTTFKAGLSSDCQLSNVKALFYPNGSTVATLVAEAGGTGISGTNAPVHAPQVCVVASLRTGGAGSSYRGRLYVPFRGSGISALGVLTGAAQTSVAAYAQALASSIISALVSSSIASTWGVYSPKLGSLTPINSILIGNQCDTIRHRNRNRNEVYTSTAVSATDIQAEPGSDFEAAVKALENAEIKISPLPGGAQDFTNALLDVIPPEAP